MLAGQTALPQIDGVPVTAAPAGRVIMSEDRRYLYLKDRFRFNFHGRFKNMTDDEVARNQAIHADLCAPPLLRSYVADGHKLIVTSLALGADGQRPLRPVLDSYAARLMGNPSVAYHGDRLYGCEYYDLAREPRRARQPLGALDHMARGVARLMLVGAPHRSGRRRGRDRPAYHPGRVGAGGAVLTRSPPGAPAYEGEGRSPRRRR